MHNSSPETYPMFIRDLGTSLKIHITGLYPANNPIQRSPLYCFNLVEGCRVKCYIVSIALETPLRGRLMLHFFRADPFVWGLNNIFINPKPLLSVPCCQ